MERTLPFFRRACLVCGLAFCLGTSLLHAADSSRLQTVSVDELRQILQAKKGPKPLLFYVGPRMLYTQAHIPGSEFIGQGGTAEGLQNLRKRAGTLSRKSAIVLYCGCCPWSHCPNVNPASDTLAQMGFTNVKVLYIPNNFGADWVDKGFPVAKGE